MALWPAEIGPPFEPPPPRPEPESDGEDLERIDQEIESRRQAFVEYAAYKARKEKEQEQEECPHDEHDHGICLSCGLDIFDDLLGRAELLRDE